MSEENDKLFQRLISYMEQANEKQIGILKAEVGDLKTEIKTEIASIKSIVEEESKKRKSLEVKQKEIDSRLTRIEKLVKKNNIVIFGLKHKGENLLDFTIRQLNQLLKINLNNLHINNIFVIGDKQENRPILVQFTTFLTKLDVLKQCNKLKGTGVRISEDYSKEEREERKILLKHQHLARNKNLNAYIKRNKLIINDETYTAKELENLDSERDTESIIGDTEKNTFYTKANSAPPTPGTSEGVYEIEKSLIIEETDNIQDIKKKKLAKSLSSAPKSTAKPNTRNAASKKHIINESPIKSPASTAKTNTLTKR